MIHHVQLSAPPGAEHAARAFWRGVIGLDEVEKPPALAGRGGCWFRGSGIEVHVGIEPEFRAASRAHPGLIVGDLDALAERLRSAGSPVTWDEDFPGMRRFYTADPFGNRVEFLQPLTNGPRSQRA